MEPFEYFNGVLHCERVSLTDVAERFETPTYVYSQGALVAHYDRLAQAFAALAPELCFAVKSCHNLHILRLLRDRGASFDVVSNGEVQRVIEAGGDPAKITFAGVGKTDREISTAIEAGVGCFNVESEGELEALIAHAKRADKVVHAALRINPDVDALTHPYTTTGKRENKFGVDLERASDLFARFANAPHVRLEGIHLHIGSPVNTVAPYVAAIRRTLALIDDLSRAGVVIDLLNLGGGWGVCYQDRDAATPEEYAEAIIPLLERRELHVRLEPGRCIAANAGVLLARTLYVKQGREHRFVICDAAMTDLIRPALYSAYHFLWPVEPGDGFIPPGHGMDLKLPGAVKVDVVGPVCESGDFLAKDRWLPPVKRGDLLAVFSAGAYGAVMSSQYNSRPRAAEVLVDGDSTRLIRRRETYDDLVSAERGL
jgi:diaminopimelate decarboxylase